MGHIVPGGGPIAGQGINQTTGKGDHNESHQNGAEDLAQPVGELFRPQSHHQSRRKKYQGIDQPEEGEGGVWSGKGGHRHLKGGSGGAGNGQTGANSQIGDDGEGLGEERVDPAAQLVQAPGPCRRHHTQYRKAHGADGKAQKGGPGGGSRLGSDARRED